MKWRLLLIGSAVAALLVPLPSPFVERYYSTALFPSIQSIATSVSNLTAVTWLDLFIVLVGAGLLVRCGNDVLTRSPGSAAARIAARVITVASVCYLAFLVMWGLNYRREPLREKVAYDAGRITAEAALALARETVARVNTLHDTAHAEGWPAPRDVDPALARAFADATHGLGLPRAAVPGRPKQSLLDLYFRRAGIAGMTDPFFLETLVASDVLPFERPHVVAHEWAHLAGITNEGEANFVGWLTCMRGSTAHRYSGWLFLYGEVLAGLPGSAAREASASLGSGPRADLQAIRQRYEREVNPRLQSAGWEVYDQYLKANRVAAGNASYAEVVQLVLGTGIR